MAGNSLLGVAIVGCGNVAGRYAEGIKGKPDMLRLAGAFDLVGERTKAFTEKYGGKPYGSLDLLLSDEDVEVVVNLTTHTAHVEVITRSLTAGKHVYSEKPLTTNRDDAVRLVKLAEEKGVRLSCAPCTFMGEAQQTAWKTIRDGKLGTIRAVFAEMNHGRIESWHPAAEDFYKHGVGPLFDVGVYPLTVLTTILGPVARVSGFARVLYRERVKKDGTPFQVEAPDFVIGVLEFVSGPVARLTTSFYVDSTLQQGIEFHGDLASLHLLASDNFDAPVKIHEFGRGEWNLIPNLGEQYKGVEWGRALFDLAEAIRDGRPHRATGAQACHVVDICYNIIESSQSGKPLKLSTTFDPPAPMLWAE